MAFGQKAMVLPPASLPQGQHTIMIRVDEKGRRRLQGKGRNQLSAQQSMVETSSGEGSNYEGADANDEDREDGMKPLACLLRLCSYATLGVAMAHV
mmetsp:Transcript_46395/g.140535  ORF Transcript_46395/g.140535 Transcript_46395/m.140535 type:complete len:96 (+) Transcript_46395:939-1226(+)